MQKHALWFRVVNMAKIPYINLFFLTCLISFCIFFPSIVFADKIRIAVASNFANPIKAIVNEYEKDQTSQIDLIFGSTGKFFAQIKHGAPFDILLAADVKRPKRLEDEGLVVEKSRFTYAIGKLVLWSSIPHFVEKSGLFLEKQPFRFLAIANPKLAPYGQAAKEALLSLNLWETTKLKLVQGENIGQTLQFVKSGNAELGFIAYSQFKMINQNSEGSFWIVPQSLYSKINQQAVLIRDSQSARNFLNFLQSEEILDLIQSYGYDTPK